MAYGLIVKGNRQTGIETPVFSDSKASAFKQ